MDKNNGRVFVMGDIHGAYKALRQCLQRSEFHHERDTLIQLGDIVDGYSESFDCVEELLRIRHLVSIKGNHDGWFAEFIETGNHPMGWNYGGKATYMSYLRQIKPLPNIFQRWVGLGSRLRSIDIPQAHVHFFNSQLLYFIDAENRCFVHAGFDKTIDFFEQPEINYYFDRTLWTEAFEALNSFPINGDYSADIPFSEVFIGHTATTHWGIMKPIQAFGITNLDTGAGHNGKLTIMEIHSKNYWQSDRLDELYPDEFDIRQ
ncbi:metallophosphoesterase [Sphingobacterium sp. LRF_L2]|uniref:metallophosphoesterase n=1 Tax=Sphingobacterium sp. LRF_L2 TaxID=3369421 RepID=UPI003F5F68D8